MKHYTRIISSDSKESKPFSPLMGKESGSLFWTNSKAGPDLWPKVERSLKGTLFFFLFFASFSVVVAQEYTPLYYNYNGIPENGIKITTKIPFLSSNNMPTLIIEGYDYGRKKSIGLIINWYVYNNSFRNYSISSHGATNPEIKLANEGGFVVIFLDQRSYFCRFMVRAYGKGLRGEIAANYEGWTHSDDLITGSYVVTVPYRSKTWDANGTTINYTAGNVGVGTINPDMKLSVFSDTKFVSRFHANETSDLMTGIRIGRKLPGKNAYADLVNLADGFGISVGSSSGNLALNTQNPSLISIYTNASSRNVGIGTTNPGIWKLAVNGNVRAKEIKVETGWSDFVFYDDYKLPSLSEVEDHINEKGHLQDIPSAEEVEKNGIFLGEMNAKLLQKIEELTLYAIDQEKRLERQEGQIDVLMTEMAALKKNEKN